MKKQLTIGRHLFIALSVFVFAGQTTLAQNVRSAVQISNAKRELKAESFIRTELYFGRSSPNGEVSEESFNDFVSEIITREFPDGFTLLDGVGQFKDASGEIIKENTKVLVLFYPSENRRTNSRKIESIRGEYKKRFQQQSVLRVDSVLPVKISF